MRNALLLIVLLVCRAFPAAPPDSADRTVKIWVSLRDKGPAALGRPGSRAFEDAPVHPPYAAALRARGLRGGVTLKWQNLVSGYVPVDSMPRLRALPFVRSVSFFPRKVRRAPLPFRPWSPFPFAKRNADSGIDYGQNRPLAESLRVERVHEWMAGKGMTPGRGVKVAVIDADFHLGNRIFDSLRTQGRILDQWDFVDDDAEAYDTLRQESHGASCMSLIGGNLPGTLVGLAPGAGFLLYRGEDDFQERYVEEDYVAAAIERAVDSGAQVISISLGYRNDYTDGSPNLPYSEMDGKHRPSSIAAAKAAGRNVLVSVAAGNEGLELDGGPSLGAPGDADSILAVGIVDMERIRCGYSSTGPAADGRVKPDVVSMATAHFCMVAVAWGGDSSGSISEAGTSFAAPAVAGVATLIRQIHPEMSAMEVRAALIKTADRYANPDPLVGYGLIDASAALGLSVPILIPSLEPRIVGLYHQGGRGPLILPWAAGLSEGEITVVDFRGRNIPVTARKYGAALLLDPDRDLRTGLYLVRVLPLKP
jgi:serine protease AprX